MARKQNEPRIIDRRQFLRGAGAIAVTGAVATLAACVPTAKREIQDAKVSAVIVHDQEECTGCGVCGLMCSLYHEGEQGPSLARSQLVRDPFEAVYTVNLCQQCRSPSCYFACPLKDSALCIDEETGTKYVNTENCDGCGKCIKACPLKPARVKLHPTRNVAINCDLCRDREDGPICVKYCSMQALSFVPGERREA